MTENDLALLREWSHDFRSFAALKKNIDKQGVPVEQLRAFAVYLQAFQMNETGDRKRLSCNFFDEYVSILAGTCGCSRFIPDHCRITIKNPQAFLSLSTALYYTSWIDCNLSDLTSVIECGFDTGYRYYTLRDKLGKGSELSDVFSQLFSSPKIKNLVKDPPEPSKG